MRNIFTLLLITFSTGLFAENIVHETDWVGSKEMESIIEEMNNNRLFACRSEGRVNGISIEYKVGFCPFRPGMEEFYTRWGMSDAGYEKYSDEYLDDDFIEHSHSTFQDLSGNTVHQATWILMSE